MFFVVVFCLECRAEDVASSVCELQGMLATSQLIIIISQNICNDNNLNDKINNIIIII